MADCLPTDRDLLFCLQAFRLRLADERVLVDAVQAVARGEAPSAREEVVRRAGLTAEQAALVDEAIDRRLHEEAETAELPPSYRPPAEWVDVARQAGVPAGAGAAGASPPWFSGAWVLSLTAESPGRYSYRGGDRNGAEIGRGGIGRVLVARDEHLGREVAIKELLLEALAASAPAPGQATGAPPMPAAAVRFLREARITGQLEHPGIVPVYELGLRPDGTPYYAMRLVRGRTMSQVIRSAATLEERLKLLPHYARLCHAIGFAHDRSVVHRDIKPANVMLGEFGETVVLDWGLAKMMRTGRASGAPADEPSAPEEARPSLTRAGAFVGTPAYMSPEQAAGDPAQVDERSDVWSLGVVLYEILTGFRPFGGESPTEIRQKVLVGPLLPPLRLEPRAPAELASVCLKALRRERDARYANAEEMARDVDTYLTGGLVPTHRYTPAQRLRRFAARNRSAVIGGLGTLVAVLAALVVVLASWAGERAARTEAQLATQREQRERLRANYHLAAGAADKATRAGRERDHLAAGVYAAGSLLHNPATPGSPQWSAEFARAAPDSAGLRLEAASRLYQSGALAAAAHERTIDVGRPVLAASFSPDGRTVAVACADGKARLWDASTGAPVRELEADPESAWAAVFSPDGKTVATGGRSGEIRLWNAATGALERRLLGHRRMVQDLKFSPDGTRIASAGQDGTVRLWDTETGAETAVLTGHEGSVYSLSFDAGGTRLASGGRDRTIRLWDARSGSLVRTFEGHEGAVPAVALSPDGSRLASTSYDRTTRLWDTESGAWIAGGEPFEDEGTSVAFGTDGRRVLAAGGPVVRVVDAVSGRVLTVIRAHEATVWNVTTSRDGTLVATSSEDGRVRLWRLRPGAPAFGEAGQGYLWLVRFSPDGALLATGGADGAVRLWDVRTGELRAALRGEHGDVVGDVSFSPDGKRAASGAKDGSVLIWETGTGRVLARLVGHEGFVRAAQFSPDGTRLATAGHDGTVRLWDASSGAPVFVRRQEGGAVRGGAFSRDGALLATAGNDGRVVLWSTADGSPRHAIAVNDAGILGLDFSHDGRLLAAAGMDGNATLWDASSWRLVRTLAFHSPMLSTVRFSPDDRRLVTAADDHKVAVWDVETGEPRLVLETAAGAMSADFSPDGRAVAVGDDDVARLYPLETAFPATPPERLLADAERAAGAALDGLRLRPYR